jgi:TM2 domain-containing membrane protein YozV
MPIRVSCGNCQRTFDAPDNATGKTAKCPGCGVAIQIPSPEPLWSGSETPSTGPSLPCPYCGEMILASAKKCKHCGEFLDAGAHPVQPVMMATVQREWSPGIAALLSFLIPGAGQLYKGSIISGLLWFVAVSIGYLALIIPGLILHVICIFAAASGDPYSGARKAAERTHR